MSDGKTDRPRVGVALGAGGARGWAHVGAIRALEAVGLAPDVVCGTSMGAAVGAAYAAGKLDQFEAWAKKLDRRTVLGLFDFSFRGGLIEASRVFDHLQDVLPDVRIEDLPIPFGAVATDYLRGTEVRIQRGPLREALRASIAIPGLISPARWEGRWMVDGGLVDPVPVAFARSLGADLVVAVELSASKGLSSHLANALSEGPVVDPGLDDQPDASPGPRPSQDFLDALSELSERFWSQIWPTEAQKEEPRPSVYEVIGQSLQIMQVRIARSRLAGDPPDLLIVPRVQNVGLIDFDRAEEAMTEGARAVRVALAGHADFRRPERE